MKKEKYSVGMIVSSADGKLGVVDAVNTDKLDGDSASVLWFNGESSAWHSHLEIIENPTLKYRKKYNNKQVIVKTEDGQTVSFKWTKDRLLEEAIDDFLLTLDMTDYDYESILECFVNDIYEAIKYNENKIEYEYSHPTDDQDSPMHTLTVEIMNG